jgi:hypothetical protein
MSSSNKLTCKGTLRQMFTRSKWNECLRVSKEARKRKKHGIVFFWIQAKENELSKSSTIEWTKKPNVSVPQSLNELRKTKDFVLNYRRNKKHECNFPLNHRANEENRMFSILDYRPKEKNRMYSILNYQTNEEKQMFSFLRYRWFDIADKDLCFFLQSSLFSPCSSG